MEEDCVHQEHKNAFWLVLYIKKAAGWVVVFVVAQKQSKMNWWELCLTVGGSRCVSASMRRDEDGIQLGLD